MEICLSCGTEGKINKSKLCDACQALAALEFYEIKTPAEAKEYAKRFFKHPARETIMIQQANLQAELKDFAKTKPHGKQAIKIIDDFITMKTNKAIRAQKEEIKTTNMHIDKLFQDHKEGKVGILPSQCTICNRYSKNNDEFSIASTKEEIEKYVKNKEKLKTPCGLCGSLAHYLKEFYGFKAGEANTVLKEISKVKGVEWK